MLNIQKEITHAAQFLQLLKNYCETKDSYANWFTFLQKELEDRSFELCRRNDPWLFARGNCTFVAFFDDWLMFCKNDRIFKVLMQLLEKEFKLTDEEKLGTFFGTLFKKNSQNFLELTQLNLMQRIIDTLHLKDESKTKQKPAIAALHEVENCKKKIQD